MSIANTLIRIQEKITSLREGILSAYNLLRWKGATMPTNLTASNLGNTIQTIPLRDSIQVEPLNDDTIFVDIDGTILYKLHPNEVASLTELPPPPQRDGMEFAGWTHTLDEIKDGTWHDVGALYTATKGVVHFSIKEKTYVELILKCSSQDFKVSWGDGTEDNNSTMQNGIFSHTYDEGEYDCVIENNGTNIAMSIERKYAKFVTGILTLPNGTYSVDFSDTSIIGVNVISGLYYMKFLRSHLQAINVPPDTYDMLATIGKLTAHLLAVA